MPRKEESVVSHRFTTLLFCKKKHGRLNGFGQVGGNVRLLRMEKSCLNSEKTVRRRENRFSTNMKMMTAIFEIITNCQVALYANGAHKGESDA